MNNKYKGYSQGQLLLLPPSLEELITPGHVARVIDGFIEHLDIDSINNAFPGGGCPPYNPVMMLKVIIYAYCSKTFSSREIERNLNQDIVYMWLSGMQRPDHNTINRFRSYYLSRILDEVFFQVVWMLKEQGYISLKELFVDGTKIEANAGRYTYVWRKTTEHNKENVKRKIALLMEEIDQINAKEDKELGDRPNEELTIGERVDPRDIKAKAEQTSCELKNKVIGSIDKKKHALLKKKGKELDQQIGKLTEYESREAILDGRNSYSKTDHDATFMRDKGGNLRPCYNPIISTEGQYMVNVTLSQNAADNVGFIEHVNKLLGWQEGKLKPENYVGDAGFGNEENYVHLSEQGIGNYLKYNNFVFEQTNKYLNNRFLPCNMGYDPQEDCYTCPAGKKIIWTGETERETATGYTLKAKVYQCEDCSGCQLATECKKNHGNRTFSKSEKLEMYKDQARINLKSAKGIELQNKRGHDVETAWADIKHNMGIRKLKLRGLEKATKEILWIALAHNMRKVAKNHKKAA